MPEMGLSGLEGGVRCKTSSLPLSMYDWVRAGAPDSDKKSPSGAARFASLARQAGP